MKALPVSRPRSKTFRLAETAEDFAQRLEHPRAFARTVGAGLGEYLCRALSHRAALTEPKDLAWLLASYARDALARVEAAGDTPQLTALRTALEEALGIHFQERQGHPLLLFHAGADAVLRRILRLGVVGTASAVATGYVSTGMRPSGICAHRYWRRYSHNLHNLVGSNRSAWSKFWTGPPRPSTA